MFFKKNNKVNNKSVNSAYFATFIFWSAVLLINSTYEFYGKEFISSSWIILIMGLIVFFLTEYISGTIRKSQANK
jgi:hypothetical protein